MQLDWSREYSVSSQNFTLYKEHMFEYNGGNK
mgnify:CR=1 FL=1